MDVDEAEVLDHLQITFVDFKNAYYKSGIDNLNQIIEYHNLSEKVISEWYYELADLRELCIEVERYIIKSINDLQNESELTPYLSIINTAHILIMLILPSYISVSIFVDNPIILLDSRNGRIENMFQLINLFIL